VGDLVDDAGSADRAGVDPHLVGAVAQQQVDVVDASDAAADGERDEDRLGGAPDHVPGRRAPLVGRRDVEEGQLVGAFDAVLTRQLDRIPGVAKVDEVDTLDHPAVMDVQTRDDADRD